MKGFKSIFEATLAIVEESYISNCCSDYDDIIYKTINYTCDIEYDLCPNDNDDKIICVFNLLEDHKYTFDINYFSGSSFEKFYILLHKRFGSETDIFGTITETFDGKTTSIIKKLSLENIINSMVYALKELFICIKQIVETHKEKTLSYCVLQDLPEESYNYEQYIHNVACKVIVDSGYYKDTLPMTFDKVAFICEEREFCSYLITDNYQ